LYDDLTVRENVVAGLAARERGRASEDDLQRTLELLELTDLAELPAGELSQGRRQLVSIARALIGDPRVVLLDEPASGLDTTESEWLGERLRTIRDSGVTILLVDHDMHLVLNLCEQIHVLDFGRLIASGTPAVVKADRSVTEAYLGSTHAEQATAAT
jgi:ABC-type branched-subunit amino acid transport system ATPase component